MSLITGPGFLSFEDLYTTFPDIPSGYSLGMKAYGGKGEIFRFALAGGTTLVQGNLLQTKANNTQFDDMAVLSTAIALGGTVQTVTITNGTTTIAAHDFDGGQVAVSVTPDGGSSYMVAGHGTDPAGSANISFTLDRPLRTAWTTLTKVSLRPNPWSNVIQFPATTQTGIPVGVALFAITNAQYGWVQTHGESAVLSDGSVFAIGSEVGTPSGTAGAVTVYAAGTTHTKVGTVQRAAATGKWIPVFLQID